jgi:hypothetical protein
MHGTAVIKRVSNILDKRKNVLWVGNVVLYKNCQKRLIFAPFFLNESEYLWKASQVSIFQVRRKLQILFQIVTPGHER